MLRHRVLPALPRWAQSRLNPDDDARALRTGIAARVGRDWVWPYWLDRQIDPDSPAFVPLGAPAFLANVTQRNWTAVGNLDAPSSAVVDPRGLVTAWPEGWSLDWWIGADDRWHLPSREVAVRQGLVDNSPVVETVMRIPGGDAVQRVYGMRQSSTEGGADLVVVEVENRSKVPVALALAVRPYNPEGLAVVEQVDLPDPTTLTVDGQPAVLLPKPPSASAASTLDEGDSARTVLDGEAGTTWPGPVYCRAGLAQATVVYPLAHSATLRCVIPAEPQDRDRGYRITRMGRSTRPASTRSSSGVEGSPVFPAALPAATDVAQGWVTQAERGARFELPDTRLADAVAANRRFLLLRHEGADIRAGSATSDRSDFRFRDAAAMLTALNLYGYHDEAAQVLASYPDRQRMDGYFLGRTGDWEANGAALWALGQHLRLTGDHRLIEAMVGPIAKGAHWIDRTRRGRGGRGGPGRFADHLYRDHFWNVAGLQAAARMLAAIDQPEAAADAASFAETLWAEVEQSMDAAAERLGTRAVPAGPLRRLDPWMVEGLVACWPLSLTAAADDRTAATLDVLRERYTSADGEAFYRGADPAGLGTSLTLQLAGVELAAGDPMALDRLGWFLDAATATWTWPDGVHPRLPGGCAGDGHSGRAAAALLSFVRDLLMRETDDGLALSSLVPDSWLGQGWEVYDAPTAHGRLSYAVRWHGERPALLWELAPHGRGGDGEVTADGAGDDAEPVTLTVPGLDPTWSTTERQGEALLGPVAPRNPVDPAPSSTSSPVSFG